MEITKETYNNVNFCLKCGSKLIFKTDHEKKLRKMCEICGWTFYKNPIPAAACVILNEKNEIVIIKRSIEPKIGEWALPSGYIEINHSPEQTAIEEMREETGLIGEVEKFLGYYHGHSPIYERIISFGFLMKIVGGKLQAGDDAADAKFVSFDKLPPIAFAAHRFYIEEARKMISHEGHE